MAGAREARPLSWPFDPRGWVPNFNDWNEGDLLVMEQVPGDQTAAIVRTYQAQNAPYAARQYADCTHCAVYLGEGLIADSRFRKAVTIRRLFPELIRRRVAVLRWDSTFVHKDQVRGFLRAVFDLENVPYAQSPPSLFRWHSGRYLSSPATNGLVCSGLIEYAAYQVNMDLAKAPGQHCPMLPAAFLTHPWLRRINTDWRAAQP